MIAALYAFAMLLVALANSSHLSAHQPFDEAGVQASSGDLQSAICGVLGTGEGSPSREAFRCCDACTLSAAALGLVSPPATAVAYFLDFVEDFTFPLISGRPSDLRPENIRSRAPPLHV